MFLKNISISHFKSHNSTKIELEQGVNCVTGKNGVGKTNILDAIYCLLNGKSYFQITDSLCILMGESYYLLKGAIQNREEISQLMVSFQTGKRKSIKINDESVSKLAEYFGKYPCVVIAPDDVEIINGESEQRRRFFDYMLSVIDLEYLKHLTAYNKLLESRNKQLKLFLENNTFDAILIQFYNDHLETHGTYIYNARKKATDIFETFFHQAYAKMTDNAELPVFKYISKLQNIEFPAGFSQTLAKDRILGRTSFGIHRDDWSFELNEMPLKKTGSQGQIKSFLIALKLAMYQYIHEQRQIKPLLLLDDIFEKIDKSRMQQLVNIISETSMGQVVITDTSSQRVQDYFKDKFAVKIIEI